MGPTPATLLEATLSGRTSTVKPPGEVRPAYRRPTILMPIWTITAAEGPFRVQATDAACIEAIAATGGEVVLVPLRTPCTGEDALDLVLQRVLSCDGLFFPGSAADVHPGYYAQHPHPRTSPPHALLDWWVVVMTLLARGAGIPVLGVCGGAQRMSVALGGTLQQDLPGHRAEPVFADNYVRTLPHVQAVVRTQQWQEYWWVHLPDMLHEHDHVLGKITSCYELTRGASFLRDNQSS